MSLINVNSDAISATLPTAAPYASTIKARASLRAQWRAQASKVTLINDLISRIDPVAGAVSIGQIQATEAARPPLVAGVFKNKYPAIRFDGSTKRLQAESLPYVKTDPFTWVFIGTLAQLAGTSTIAALFNVVSNSTQLTLMPSGSIQFIHGNGSATLAPPSTGGYAATPLCIIASSNQSALNLRVNGRQASGVTNNAQTATAMFFGSANAAGTQSAQVDMAEFMVFQEDISTDADFIAVIEGYARRNYLVAV